VVGSAAYRGVCLMSWMQKWNDRKARKAEAKLPDPLTVLPLVSDQLPHAAVISHATAAALSAKASHSLRLFHVFQSNPAGLTVEEAAREAGLDRWAAAKRVSDLVADGVLEPVYDMDGEPVTKRGSSGRKAGVYALPVPDSTPPWLRHILRGESSL